MKLSHLALAASLLAACGRGVPPADAPPAPEAGAPSRPGTSRGPAAPGRADRGEEGPAPELTLASFRSFTKRRGGDVRRCYEAALANDQSLRGKLTLTFAILPGGGVSDVRVARSTFRSPAVPTCVATVVRGWRTPFRPEEPVDVEYPIDFGPR